MAKKSDIFSFFQKSSTNNNTQDTDSTKSVDTTDSNEVQSSGLDQKNPILIDGQENLVQNENSQEYKPLDNQSEKPDTSAQDQEPTSELLEESLTQGKFDASDIELLKSSMENFNSLESAISGKVELDVEVSSESALQAAIEEEKSTTNLADSVSDGKTELSKVEKNEHAVDTPSSKSPVKQQSLVLEDSENPSGPSTPTSSKKVKRTKEEYAEERRQIRMLKEAKKEEERKLRDVKREEERKEREAKREEERKEREAKKEEERKEREAKKEQEKLEREAKKEQEKRERDAKKEEERIAKEKKLEEERLQKEKVLQKSRISNFFKVSSSTASKPKSLDISTKESTPVGTVADSNNTQLTNTPLSLHKPVKSDYQKSFSAFYVKDGYKLSSSYQFSPEELTDKMNFIDQKISENSPITDIEDTKSYLQHQKSIYMSKHSQAQNPPLTALALLKEIEKGKKSDEEMMELLKTIPHKYIKFYENIRPPYTGTFSDQTIIPKNNPFSTSETNYDYSYDSDLDWVDGSDGEVEDLDELEDDDEEDNDDPQDEGEFDGFLDQDMNDTSGGQKSTNEDGNNVVKRKVFLTALIPSVQLQNDNTYPVDEDEKKYMESVSIKLFFPTPIDTTTVQGKPVSAASTSENNKKRKIETVIANESEIKSSRDTATEDGKSISSETPVVKKAKSQPAIITKIHDIINILKEVQGSTFTVSTLSEIAKVKTATSYSKKIIKDTIQFYAAKDSSTQTWNIKNMEEFEKMKKQLESETETNATETQTTSEMSVSSSS